MEDEHDRRRFAVSEGVQDLLVRLVGGVTRNRKLLVPPLRHPLRAECAERCQQNPGPDDEPPPAMDEVRESAQHHSASTSAVLGRANEDRYAASRNSSGSS